MPGAYPIGEHMARLSFLTYQKILG